MNRSEIKLKQAVENKEKLEKKMGIIKVKNKLHERLKSNNENSFKIYKKQIERDIRSLSESNILKLGTTKPNKKNTYRLSNKHKDNPINKKRFIANAKEKKSGKNIKISKSAHLEEMINQENISNKDLNNKVISTINMKSNSCKNESKVNHHNKTQYCFEDKFICPNKINRNQPLNKDLESFLSEKRENYIKNFRKENDDCKNIENEGKYSNINGMNYELLEYVLQQREWQSLRCKIIFLSRKS